jgi:hypothetical protein
MPLQINCLLVALVHIVSVGPVQLFELGRFREMPDGSFAHACGRDGIAQTFAICRQSSAWRR